VTWLLTAYSPVGNVWIKVLSNGKTGVGTTSPAALLTVSGGSPDTTNGIGQLSTAAWLRMNPISFWSVNPRPTEKGEVRLQVLADRQL